MKKSLLILVLCSPIFFLTQANESNKSGNRALLIGIDHYKYTNDLIGTTNDVKLMYDLLVNHKGFKPQEITILLNEQATYDNIDQAMQNLSKETKAGDKILFYFSGHGFQIDDANGDEADGKDEVLITHDASYNGDENAPPLAALNMITDDQLATFFNALNDRQVEVIVDSCHSGSITKAPKNNLFKAASLVKTPFQFIDPKTGRESYLAEDSIKSLFKPSNSFDMAIIPPSQNRKVWTATSPHEVAFIDIREKKEPVSVFTYSFVQGIIEKKADINNDGKITTTELLNYTKKKSRVYCLYLQEIRQVCTSLIPTFNHIPENEKAAQ